MIIALLDDIIPEHGWRTLVIMSDSVDALVEHAGVSLMGKLSILKAPSTSEHFII